MKGFERIIGYQDVKNELKRICDILKNYEKYERLGVTMPAGLLLHGEPGVGKTTMAISLIEASGRKEFVCRKCKPNGEFVKEIAETFENARKNAPSIVFLDDMDKYANGDKMHKDKEEYVTIQTCIDDVRGSDVFVIATANSIHNLPDSLLRVGRFDKTIKISEPEGKDAENIVSYYLSKKSFIEGIDTREIARILDGRSCAELESVINEAGIYAAYDDRDKICMDDILRAFMRIIYKAPECMTEKDPEIVRMIACHEAGHAIVSEILNPGSVTLVTVKGHGGSVGGFTAQFKPDGYWYSKKEMEGRIISILSGKAATELEYGVTDVGANNDLHRAFDIVERFVDDYCSYGFDSWIQSANTSNNLLSIRDAHIQSEMSRYYEEARRIVAQNRDYLKNVTDALAENLTISGAKVRELRKEAS